MMYRPMGVPMGIYRCTDLPMKDRDKIIVWHKPTCSKCIDATAFMKEHGVVPDEWREYLVDVPSEDEIRDVIKKLNIPAEKLVRKKEQVYLANYAGQKLSDVEWIKVLHEHPVLIERPIIIRGNRAFIGRSEEELDQLL